MINVTFWRINVHFFLHVDGQITTAAHGLTRNHCHQ